MTLLTARFTLLVAATVTPLVVVLSLAGPEGLPHATALARTPWPLPALTVLAVVLLGIGYWEWRVGRPLRRLAMRALTLAGEPPPHGGADDDLETLALALDRAGHRLDALQRAAHRAQLADVALGVVHDLATPIQNLGNSCKALTRSWNDLEYRATFTRTVDRELAHVRRLLGELHAEVQGPAPPALVELGPCLAALVQAMQPAAALAGVVVHADLPCEPVVVEGDRLAVERIGRNLLRNALEATPGGGRVVVRLRRRAGAALVEVVDTGQGIPSDALDVVFDEFTTTKPDGLGVGLAVCRRLADRLRGSITVTSTPGAGSTFALRLPLAVGRLSHRAAG